MHWSSKYLGLPWKIGGRDRDGIDCYGLVAMIYRDELGIEIDSLTGAYASEDERALIASVVAGQKDAGAWVPVEPGHEQEFDCVMFRYAGHESHIGVVVEKGRMIHQLLGRRSAVEPYGAGFWANMLEGAWRHKSRL